MERNLLQPVTVLKTAHHGSAYSSSETFLEAIRPAVAVISCGEKNRYGHPASETIERLEQADTSIAYTMKSGQISVVKSMANGRKCILSKIKGRYFCYSLRITCIREMIIFTNVACKLLCIFTYPDRYNNRCLDTCKP